MSNKSHNKQHKPPKKWTLGTHLLEAVIVDEVRTVTVNESTEGKPILETARTTPCDY